MPQYITQQEEIKKLKELNAAYIAALEYDYCPEGKKAKEVIKLLSLGIPDKDVKRVLEEHGGSKPYQLADQMSTLIKELK